MKVYMKCGCSLKKDESEKVFGVKAKSPGDMAYCPRHGDVRLIDEKEKESIRKVRGK